MLTSPGFFFKEAKLFPNHFVPDIVSPDQFVPDIVSHLPCSPELVRHTLLFFLYFFKELISFIDPLDKCHTSVFNALISLID